MNHLKETFKITIGTLENFLGMKIDCEKNGCIQVSQRAFINKILDRFRMMESNPVSTPATQDESENSDNVASQVPYREAIRSLMHLMTATRPDFAFPVNRASRALEKPTNKNWSDVKRIFRYLKGTSDLGIVYKTGKSALEVYSDAYYAGDKATRRSTSGIVAMFADGAVA